jgi:hypothetical protein
MSSTPTLSKAAAERLSRLSSRPATAERFAAYAHDPVGFARDVLDVELWHRQAEIAEAVRDHPATSARSGHKVGKTLVVVALGLWWVSTRHHGRVILTSSNASQVKHQLWDELRRVYREAGGERVLGGDMALDPSTGLRFADGRKIIGLTAADPEGFAGYSGAELLVCIDEASGFDPSIFEALATSMAGGGKILATGNPTQPSGWFFEAFTSQRELWRTIHVDSREAAEVEGIPGLATAQWIDRMVAEHGGGDPETAALSPIFQVRVMGEFPVTADDQVVPMGLVEAATDRYLDGAEPPVGARLVVGCDVARFGGDASCIQPVRGSYAWPATELRSKDGFEVAAEVIRIADQLRNHGGDVPIVAVDSSGGHGSSVIDALNRQGTVQVVPVNAGEAATQSRFAKLRDELWWSIREWLEADAALPPDSRRDAELIAPKYDHDAALRVRVEKKSATKARIGRSPDRADALALATWVTMRRQRHTGPVAFTRKDKLRREAARGGRGRRHRRPLETMAARGNPWGRRLRGDPWS